MAERIERVRLARLSAGHRRPKKQPYTRSRWINHMTRHTNHGFTEITRLMRKLTRRTKRRGQDSNLRYPRRYNRLAGGPDQPLWHLSIFSINLLRRLRRRGQDSNLRYGGPYNGFQDHRLKPLGHLSNCKPSLNVARIMLAQRPVACQYVSEQWADS